jgi:hypothetical protein
MYKLFLYTGKITSKKDNNILYINSIFFDFHAEIYDFALFNTR